MSIVSENHAFISMGVSCQTAQQLQQHAGFVSSLLDDQLRERSGFFNWVFVSASEIVESVDRLIAGPITVQSLYVPVYPREALRLEDFKLWFWHEKLSDQVNQGDLERIAEKYERLRNNFLKMLAKPVRYIVLSNTQNNIENFYPYKIQGMDIMLDANIVSQIGCAPWATNQYGTAQIIALSYQHRWRGALHRSVSFLEKDDSDWQGNMKSWDEALSRHLKPNRANKFGWSEQRRIG